MADSTDASWLRHLALWNRWKRASDEDRPELERKMDNVQRFIADTPNDPRWVAFVNWMPLDYRNAPACAARRRN